MFYFFSRFLLTLMILSVSSAGFAQGDLLITPKRIVFDGTKRVDEINLANTGKDTATYTISFIQFKMDESGKFEPVADNDSTQRFAHKNVRFFPRSVTLGPNEAQSIKVQLIKTNELTTGEYRSHLYFRSMPDKAAMGEENNTATKDSGISIKLTPVFGISIPIIIRVGETAVKSSFSNLKFEIEKQLQPLLNVDLNRNGNISSYGDITVNYIGENNKPIPVCFMKGLAIYMPNNKRKLRLPLIQKEGIDYTNGKLQVVFTDQSPKPSVLCEQILQL